MIIIIHRYFILLKTWLTNSVTVQLINVFLIIFFFSFHTVHFSFNFFFMKLNRTCASYTYPVYCMNYYNCTIIVYNAGILFNKSNYREKKLFSSYYIWLLLLVAVIVILIFLYVKCVCGYEHHFFVYKYLCVRYFSLHFFLF